MGDFSKGGVHKTDGFWKVFYFLENLSAQLSRLFIFILIQIPSPWLGSPPTPSHSLITFFIIQKGAKDYQNLKTSTIQGENSFWNGIQLIDWLGILKMSRNW